MRGLARGEQSTGTEPFLQLITREGEFLKDPIEGSFIIEDVHDPAQTPTTKVTQTSLSLDLVADSGHKLGTGRFYVPTGDTTDWAYGTHRAVCTYKMVAGGRDYKQIIEFEILSPTLFPTGQDYVGYTSTMALYRDEFFVISGMSPEKLHAHIRRASLEIENHTERYFEPRYVEQYLNGSNRPLLFLDEAIVALESISTISRDADGVETLEAYDAAGYRVFNRHLDGLLNPDDRHNPRVALVETNYIPGVTGAYGEFNWPFGRRNLLVKGVFGYTDPGAQSDNVLIGHTPDDFVQIIGVMVSRYLEDPAMTNIGTWKPGLVKTYKTRDQQIQFYGASGNVDYTGGITGDSLLDQKLLRFAKPARLAYPEREEYDQWGL